MKENPNVVIVGSGLSALMLARMIRAYHKTTEPIFIIEKDAVIGGQFGSIDYGENGYFDFGMHIYYESGIPGIDILFTDVLPAEEWNILENNYKDIAGIYVNGKLQTHTPYVDLRNATKENWEKYVAGIFSTIRDSVLKPSSAKGNAYDILLHHFGKAIADEVFVPILEKLYLTPAQELDGLATQLTTINRVALFDKEVMTDLMKSDLIRARICFPDQLSLPPYRLNTQRGFYPKKFGMRPVLNIFKDLLEKDNVSFLTSRTIGELKTENNKITSVSIKDKDGNTSQIPIKELYWTAGLPPLAAALGIDVSDLKNDRKKTEAVYVNLLFDKAPVMDKLYYFYCFDKGYRTFRVTNYSNYCPEASAGRGFPLCVEMWMESSDPQEEEDILKLAEKELKSFGVIDDNHHILFSKAEKIPGGGFPLPSLNNINNIRIIRNRIAEKGIDNVIPTGVLVEDNVFFIKDVLIDAYQKILKKDMHENW